MSLIKQFPLPSPSLSLSLSLSLSPPLSPALGVGKSCHHSGLPFPHGSHWEEECNGCQCIHGNVLCSKVSSGYNQNLAGGPAGPGTLCVWADPFNVHLSPRWGAVAGPASYPRCSLAPRLTPPPARRARSAWSTSTSPASSRPATSGACVRCPTRCPPPTRYVSPTAVTLTTAASASRSSSDETRCPRWADGARGAGGVPGFDTR